MNMSEFVLAGLRLALLGAAGPAVAASISLSGTVLRLDGTGLEGVTVRLVRSGLSTSTDARGAWTFGQSPVDVRRTGVAAAAASGHLRHDGGRLAVRFAGLDAAGRGAGDAPFRRVPGTVASRSAGGAVDTLVYSYQGKAFLKDTLSNLDTVGILRVYDTTWNAAILYGELRDVRDGRTYRTATMGTQSWMAENLAYAGPSDTTGSCYYNSPDSCAKYGRLYRWNEATALPDSCNASACLPADHGTLQGACPSGWHLPTMDEWSRLTDTLLGYAGAGSALKSVSGWKTGNGTDAYGFRALPGGYRAASGSYYQAGSDGMWWAALESDPGTSWDRSISSMNTIVNQGFIQRIGRLSVRCLKD